MSEMVERVADGLIAKFKSEVAKSAEMPFEQTKVSVPDRSIWLGYARAAIEAMREPTDAMLHAAQIQDGILTAQYNWDDMISVALE